MHLSSHLCNLFLKLRLQQAIHLRLYYTTSNDDGGGGGDDDDDSNNNNFNKIIIIIIRSNSSSSSRTCSSTSCTQMHRNCHLFTALHGMQTRSSDEISVRPSVRLSVCPSVKRVDCDKTKKISPDFYTLRKIIHSSFVRKRMVGGATPST